MDSIRLFRGLAAIITLIFLSVIYFFHTGDLDISLAPFVIIALLSFSILFYVVVYHDFSEDSQGFKITIIGVLGLTLVSSTLLSIVHVIFDVFIPEFQFTFQEPGVILPPEEFLPDWWVLVLLVTAGILLIVGTMLDTERPSYSTPSGLHELAESPIYFGLAFAIIGLWGVLFVGINIVQRVVIVAPIFEEFLKFGVALAIGVAIFGRSVYSRVAIALVIGCIFGLVEHSTTYAGEPDIFYLNRVVFHSLSTMIAVAVYTSFEKHGLNNLLWIAPIYPIILHYLNNASSILSGVVLITASEETQMFVALFSSAIVILLGTILLFIAITRHNINELIHREPYSFLKAML